MLAHEAELSPCTPREPKVVWEAVEKNKAMVSLFKPRLSNKVVAKVNTTDDDDEFKGEKGVR
jgi:hypothetical protein